MALDENPDDENPDEVFDNEPEAEPEGNSDEQSNRSFRMMMIGLFAFGGLGVLLIALILIGRQGERQAIDTQNQMVQLTNTAIAVLSQITPTPPSTETPMPTNTAAPSNTPSPNDLVDTAQSTGNFNTLSSLLKTAGLVDTLKGQGPFTLFAPTDAAFAQLSPATLDALKNDPQKLAELLKYHVVQGAMKAADMAKLSEANTLDGQPVSLAVNGNRTQINDATVTTPDQQTTNGVIHTIDHVLVPPELRNEVAFVPPTPTTKDLVDAAQSTGNFNTLSSLLKSAGLVDTLKGQGPYTLFAPTDAAFAQLSPQTLDALSKNPQKLAELLKYHVVEGAVNAADVAQLTGTKTLEGNPLAVTVKNGKTQINDATMTGSEMQTANGVIHPIDRVLVPPALRSQVVALAPSTPKPGATPAAGKGTAIAQVQGTAVANATAGPSAAGQATANATAKPAAGGQATAVPTRVPPQAATATAAASKGITSTHPISGTAGTGGTGLPTTGASDNMFVLLLAAVGLVGVLVVARRLRTSN